MTSVHDSRMQQSSIHQAANTILAGLRSPTLQECRRTLVASGMNPATAAVQAAYWFRNNAHRMAERNQEAADRNQQMIKDIQEAVKGIASKYEQQQIASDFIKGF